jgi:hypothetical protein
MMDRGQVAHISIARAIQAWSRKEFWKPKLRLKFYRHDLINGFY